MESLDINLNFWVLQTIAMMITAFVLPGLKVSGPVAALGAVLAISFMNAHLWDAALFFQVPDQLSYQVLMLFVSNGVLFWILAKLLPGIEISGIVSALLAPLILTLTSVFLATYAKDIDWFKIWEVFRDTVTGVRDELKKKPG